MVHGPEAEVASPVQVTLGGPRDGWVLSFDPTADRATFGDGDEVLAVLEPAVEDVRSFAWSRTPSGLYLPSADLDLGWSLIFFPADGTLLVHNPFGEHVGGLTQQRGFEFINALRDVLRSLD